MRFAKVSLRKIRPVAIGDKFCVTDDHEVLTQVGWKNITSVTLDDKVATLNQTSNVLEWHNPINTSSFKHNGDMYEINNKLISLMTTTNHKMYVKRSLQSNFALEEAINIVGEKVWYKRDCINKIADLHEFNLPEITLPKQFKMNDWLTFIGIYLAEGHIDVTRNVKISAHNPRVSSKLEEILANLAIEYTIYPGEENYRYIKQRQISNYLSQFGTDDNKFIPNWCKCMGLGNSKALLDGLLLGNGLDPKTNSWEYYSNSKQLIDDVQLLAIMSGQSASITIKGHETNRSENQYCAHITNYAPVMQPASTYKGFTETIHDKFTGRVYCIEVPNHVFMVRRNNKYCWTGNSSRSGQKGIAALLMREADMLFNKEGIRPALVFNPHGMPSRMTVAQLLESLMGNVCAVKGMHHDATMFKSVDIESIANEFEQYGFHRYGYERMISGITGEFVDVEVYFGPTYYQRLQKFVADAEYSVRHALTDAITFQPLDGQGSSGGLKIGEMERDVLASHGVSRFLNEKFFKHSDGYTEYICRCGKPAIVNHKENIYKCKYCKDAADITAVPTSWTSKLFMQELESCNVGIRRIPRPFTFEINDNQEREFSKIDEYNEDTARQLTRIAEDMVDDTAAVVETD